MTRRIYIPFSFVRSPHTFLSSFILFYLRLYALYYSHCTLTVTVLQPSHSRPQTFASHTPRKVEWSVAYTRTSRCGWKKKNTICALPRAIHLSFVNVFYIFSSYSIFVEFVHETVELFAWCSRKFLYLFGEIRRRIELFKWNVSLKGNFFWERKKIKEKSWNKCNQG